MSRRPANFQAKFAADFEAANAQFGTDIATAQQEFAAIDKAKLSKDIEAESGGLISGDTASSVLGGLEGFLNGDGQLGAADGIKTAFNNFASTTSNTNTLGQGLTTASDAAGVVANTSADIQAVASKFGLGDVASGVSQTAGLFSKAAGIAGNLLSLKRGANIPQGADLFAQVPNEPLVLKASNKNDWRVRIRTNFSLFDGGMFTKLASTGGVVFPYTPQITFSSRANYTQIDPVHTNYPILAYKNSQIDDITIAGDFSAETNEDAYYWLCAVTFFKTATKMFYGQGPNAGNPPVICHLSGYGTNMFNNVPVVVTSFNLNLEEDVNYIKCSVPGEVDATWVPIVSKLSVTLKPIYNRRNLREFDLRAYAQGNLTSSSSKDVGYL